MVEYVADERLLVRAADPAALNAYLVGEQIRVTEIGPHRRDLERVVLEAGAEPAPRAAATEASNLEPLPEGVS
jgi:ABC-2 type transport system ATP-binding protein